MRIPFTNLEIKKETKATQTRLNEERFDNLFEQLTKMFGKNQLVYNKVDLARIINEGYLFNPDVYSIINKIVQTASMIDWQLYEIKDDKKFKQYKSYKKSNSLEQSNYYRVKALEPIEQPEIMKLLMYPNPYQTSTTFTQSLLGYYCLLGNSYVNKLTIEGSRGNIPGQLQVLPAHLVKIIFGDRQNLIKGYTIDNWDDVRYNFEKENVYHFKTFNPGTDNGQFFYGASPSFNAILTKSNDSYIAATELIRNLGAMGILSTGNDDTIDTEKTKQMENRYSQRFGGASKRGKIWIVGHKMEYQNIAQSITDLNLIQGQEQDFLTLCRLLNVDSRIMGYVKGSTFSNMNEAKDRKSVG
jgi:HK97 family phage portal protein